MHIFTRYPIKQNAAAGPHSLGNRGGVKFQPMDCVNIVKFVSQTPNFMNESAH